MTLVRLRILTKSHSNTLFQFTKEVVTRFYVFFLNETRSGEKFVRLALL